MTAEHPSPRSPSLADVASVALRVGNLTFGGGDPAMAVLQREVVEKRRWLPQDGFTLIWSLARVTPGTNVLACFAGVGWRLAGPAGAVTAAVASSLPSAALCYWLTLAERQWHGDPMVAASLRGVAATVAGMMLAGAFLLLKPAWRAGKLARALPFTALAAGASLAGAPPVAILAAAAVAGWTMGKQE